MNKTEQQRFIIGITLIIASLILGKIAFIPLFFQPFNTFWRITSFAAYGLTWVMLFLGIWFAGKEGYHLVMEKIKEKKQRTIHLVKQHGRQAAQNAQKTIHAVKQRVKRHKKQGTKEIKDGVIKENEEKTK